MFTNIQDVRKLFLGLILICSTGMVFAGSEVAPGEGATAGFQDNTPPSTSEPTNSNPPSSTPPTYKGN